MPRPTALSPRFLLDPSLSRGARLLLTVLEKHGSARARVDDLAEGLGVNARTVKRYLAELRGAGAIDTKPHGRTGGVSVEFRTEQRETGTSVSPNPVGSEETGIVMSPNTETGTLGTPKVETGTSVSPNSAVAEAPKSDDTLFSTDSGCTQPPHVSPPKLERDRQWAAFNAAYPKRYGNRGTKKGREAFDRLLGRGVAFEEVLAGAKKFAAFTKLSGDWGTRFVPQIPTWLNGDGWEEAKDLELEAPAPNGRLPPAGGNGAGKNGRRVEDFDEQNQRQLRELEAYREQRRHA